MTRLLVFQSVGAMDGLPGVDLDERLPDALARIVEAGFDGAGVNIVRTRRAEVTTHAVLCEPGPPPYAMVDADGREFSDRWQDALALKALFREPWEG